jgi:hypothetical protein
MGSLLFLIEEFIILIAVKLSAKKLAFIININILIITMNKILYSTVLFSSFGISVVPFLLAASSDTPSAVSSDTPSNAFPNRRSGGHRRPPSNLAREGSSKEQNPPKRKQNLPKQKLNSLEQLSELQSSKSMNAQNAHEKLEPYNKFQIPQELSDCLSTYFSLQSIDCNNSSYKQYHINWLAKINTNINKSPQLNWGVKLYEIPSTTITIAGKRLLRPKNVIKKEGFKWIARKIGRSIILLDIHQGKTTLGLFPYYFNELKVFLPNGKTHLCKPESRLYDDNVQNALGATDLGSGAIWQQPAPTVNNWIQQWLRWKILFCVIYNKELFIVAPTSNIDPNIAKINDSNWKTSAKKKALMGAAAAGAVAGTAAGAAAAAAYAAPAVVATYIAPKFSDAGITVLKKALQPMASKALDLTKNASNLAKENATLRNAMQLVRAVPVVTHGVKVVKNAPTIIRRQINTFIGNEVNPEEEQAYNEAVTEFDQFKSEAQNYMYQQQMQNAQQLSEQQDYAYFRNQIQGLKTSNKITQQEYDTLQNELQSLQNRSSLTPLNMRNFSIANFRNKLSSLQCK